MAASRKPSKRKPVSEPETLIGRRDLFTRFAKWASRATGQPGAFFVAGTVILAWAVTGPIFHFSDTWQLVINTGTTIITFLMVFLIQSTQNRDTQAIHIKLDELIRSHKGAHTALLNLEELSGQELDKFQKIYLDLAAKARQHLREGGKDTDVPRLPIQG
jgi:low affinity Fe/Cu permease